MLTANYSLIEPINEVYFGKTNEIKAIEKQVGVVRKKFMKKYNAKIDKEPSMTKLNRLFEKQFGFGAFALSCVPSKYINAFTIPLDNRYSYQDLNANLIADKKTFKYNPDANYSAMVFVYSGLFLNPEFTDAEILGVILHEIGHNFYGTLDGKLGVVSNLYHIINKMKGVAAAAAKSKDPIEMEKHIGMELRNPGWNVINGWMQTSINAAKENMSISDALNTLINMLTLGFANLLGSVISAPFYKIGLAQGYRNERIADNFASMYGYGAELNSALYKMSALAQSAADKAEAKRIKIPLLTSIYDLNNTAAYVLLCSVDEHPGDLQRCEDQVAMVERELTKADLDPKITKVLQTDLKACKKQLTQLKDSIKKIDDKNQARNIFMRALYNISKDNDVKKCLKYDDPQKFDNYDTIYDARLNDTI